MYPYLLRKRKNGHGPLFWVPLCVLNTFFYFGLDDDDGRLSINIQKSTENTSLFTATPLKNEIAKLKYSIIIRRLLSVNRQKIKIL